MTLDSLPDLDTSGLCLVKTLPTALTCWPYRNTRHGSLRSDGDAGGDRRSVRRQDAAASWTARRRRGSTTDSARPHPPLSERPGSQEYLTLAEATELLGPDDRFIAVPYSVR